VVQAIQVFLLVLFFSSFVVKKIGTTKQEKNKEEDEP
jgi:F0F1-type ATP synthase membrane subunit b/b'